MIGAAVLGYGLVIALLSALMTFTIQPVYTFTEWIPDNFVAWTSLKKVFWSLVGENAKLVRTGTPGLRKIELEGGLLRWGVIAMLAGAILMRKRKPKISE